VRSLRSLPPGLALFPLRLFLGVTFAYAGIQKLSDPGFLHAGAPTYIATQLHGFANGTPGGFILRTFAIPHAELAGVGVAIVEIAIGILTLTGLLTRVAAAAGMGLSLLLFLTASWHTTPYFLGPDIVFTFAWLPFVLTGATGQPALDNVAAPVPRQDRLATDRDALLTRRALIAEAGLVALGAAGIASLAKGTYKAPPQVSASTTDTTHNASHTAANSPAPATNNTNTSPDTTTTTTPPTPSVPSNAVKLAPSSRLPAGAGATYQDPGDGSTDIIIRQTDGSLTAFSAVCTHAGCTVGYQSGEIVCPCHGATYDPQTGAVTGGPAPQGLAPRKVLERGGAIYAIPS
jgi:thiosulfate dehydrogenase [quinone] large subunit